MDSELEQKPFLTGIPAPFGVRLRLGVGGGEGFPVLQLPGDLWKYVPSIPLPPQPLAWHWEGGVVPESGLPGRGGSPRTAGRAQVVAPAQFALTASLAPPAWLQAQLSSGEGKTRRRQAEEPFQPGAGNRAGGGPPGGSTESLRTASSH